MADFTCTPRETDEGVVLTVTGEVDLAVYETLVGQVQDWLKPSRQVFLDASAVTFLDSMGLRALVQLQQLAADKGAGFTLVAPSDPVERVMELSGTRQVFTILDAPLPSPN